MVAIGRRLSKPLCVEKAVRKVPAMWNFSVSMPDSMRSAQAWQQEEDRVRPCVLPQDPTGIPPRGSVPRLPCHPEL